MEPEVRPSPRETSRQGIASPSSEVKGKKGKEDQSTYIRPFWCVGDYWVLVMKKKGMAVNGKRPRRRSLIKELCRRTCVEGLVSLDGLNPQKDTEEHRHVEARRISFESVVETGRETTTEARTGSVI
jgi:hypothetical protein